MRPLPIGDYSVGYFETTMIHSGDEQYVSYFFSLFLFFFVYLILLIYFVLLFVDVQYQANWDWPGKKRLHKGDARLEEGLLWIPCR